MNLLDKFFCGAKNSAASFGPVEDCNPSKNCPIPDEIFDYVMKDFWNRIEICILSDDP